MNQAIYQHIYETISFALPADWKKAIFRVDYTEGSYGMKFYVNCSEGEYIDCFSLPKVSNSQLMHAFMAINQLIAPARNELSEKDKWSIMTVIFDVQGCFKADFDYQNISETMVAYEEDWEKKYLV